MIDLSHDNSRKDPERQPEVAAEVAEHVSAGWGAIVGVMLESFLVGGRQDLGAGELTYGQSITDGCLSFDATAEVLDVLAAAVRERRRATGR
jgi:3-deoxy-7-phosphoheptulonate synthase